MFKKNHQQNTYYINHLQYDNLFDFVIRLSSIFFLIVVIKNITNFVSKVNYCYVKHGDTTYI